MVRVGSPSGSCPLKTTNMDTNNNNKTTPRHHQNKNNTNHSPNPIETKLFKRTSRTLVNGSVNHDKRYRAYNVFTNKPLLLLALVLVSLASSSAQSTATDSAGAVGVTVRGNCGATNSSHGVCGPDGKLRCRSGWYGSLCNKPHCKSGCHPIHGHCTAPGECTCDKGWTGSTCRECLPSPDCVHGTCHNLTDRCVCKPGWSGVNCDRAVCRPGCHETRGYCDTPGDCKCRAGWSGRSCESCSLLPGCQHGYCDQPQECRCERGWTGRLCHKPICGEGCHPKHGSCIKPGDCRCQVGYFGRTCSKCHPYPGCKNGYCTRPWECICKPGWRGMKCDRKVEDSENYCENNPNACLNGGTCINVKGPRNYTCSCPSLFTGKRCDYLADRRPKPSFFKPTTASPETTSKSSTTTSTTTTTTTTTTARSTIKPTLPSLLSKVKSVTPSRTTTERTTIPPFLPTPSARRSFMSRSGFFNNRNYDDDVQPFESNERHTAQHSQIHSVTVSPRKLEEQKRQREIDAKDARRRFLQQQAKITFRQSNIKPAVRTPSRPLKIPFISDRKHLSLPVFLPRVVDVDRKNITRLIAENTQDNSREEVPRTLDVTTERRNSKSAERTTRIISTLSPIPETTAIPSTTTQKTSSTTKSSKIIDKINKIPSSKDNPDSALSKLFNDSNTVLKKETDRIVDLHVVRKKKIFPNHAKGEQTIKDLFEEYEKPNPVLVVDYEDPENKNFNEIINENDNPIKQNRNFINEKPRFLQPQSLNLASESSQESSSSGPSRPMFLVAVRPLPRPGSSSLTIEPKHSHSPIGFSHGTYPAATFLQESRNGRFVPHGRSVSRTPVPFSSPSFSVSQPRNSFNMKHFAPQTRLSRRIGHSAFPPYLQIYDNDPVVTEEDSLSSPSESKNIHFYEEHSAGSVHIGVDRHTPTEEIMNAFIEIKKSFT